MLDDAIGPKTDRVLLEFIGADLLKIFLRDDPARPGRGRAIEGHKIGPGFVQVKANMMRINDLHGLDLGFQSGITCTFIALEADIAHLPL